MSGWLLDTNVLIDLIFANSPRLDERYAGEMQAETPIYVSSVSLFEFRFGAEQSRRRTFQLQSLERFLAAATVIDFDDEDAHVAALVKIELAARGTPIGPYDLLIAAQARARNLSVATGNAREFSRVAGLTVEDWTAPPA